MKLLFDGEHSCHFTEEDHQMELILFSIHFSMLTVIFLSTCFSDARPSSARSEAESERKRFLSSEVVSPSPQFTASFLSNLTFHWFTPLVRRGFAKALTLEDLWQVNPKDSSRYIGPEFCRNLYSEQSTVDVFRAQRRTFGWSFMAGNTLKAVPDIAQFGGPFLLK